MFIYISITVSKSKYYNLMSKLIWTSVYVLVSKKQRTYDPRYPKSWAGVPGFERIGGVVTVVAVCVYPIIAKFETNTVP